MLDVTCKQINEPTCFGIEGTTGALSSWLLVSLRLALARHRLNTYHKPLLLVFVGLWRFVFAHAQPTALQPRLDGQSFVSKKEDR